VGVLVLGYEAAKDNMSGDPKGRYTGSTTALINNATTTRIRMFGVNEIANLKKKLMWL
jgi:hypothetical protein